MRAAVVDHYGPPGVVRIAEVPRPACCGGTTALFFLRDKAGLVAGMSVLVNGACGAVGTNAVQLAKHAGATVTVVTSTGNLALAAKLGADQVIDYTTTTIGDLAGRFDVVVDAVGTISPAFPGAGAGAISPGTHTFENVAFVETKGLGVGPPRCDYLASLHGHGYACARGSFATSVAAGEPGRQFLIVVLIDCREFNCLAAVVKGAGHEGFVLLVVHPPLPAFVLLSNESLLAVHLRSHVPGRHG